MEKFKLIMKAVGLGFAIMVGVLALVVGYVWVTGGFNERFEAITQMSFDKQVYLIDSEDYIMLNPTPEDATELEVEIMIKNGGEIITLPETYKIGEPIKITPITHKIYIPVLDEDGNRQYDPTTSQLITEEKDVNIGGVAELLAQSKNNKGVTIHAECKVIVDAPVEYFELTSNAPAQIYPGAEFDVSIDMDNLFPANSINPTTSTNGYLGKMIEYKSSNETIATVDANGHVVVKGMGDGGGGQGAFTITAYVVTSYKNELILPQESDYQNYEMEEYLNELNRYRKSASISFYSQEINVSNITLASKYETGTDSYKIDLNGVAIISPEDIGLTINPQLGSPYDSSQLSHYFRDLTVKAGIITGSTLEENSEYINVETIALTDYPYVNWVVTSTNHKTGVLGLEFELKLLASDEDEDEPQYNIFRTKLPITIIKKSITSLELDTPLGQDSFFLNLGVESGGARPDSAYWIELNGENSKTLTNPLTDATLQTELENNQVYNLYNYVHLNPEDATYTTIKFFVNSQSNTVVVGEGEGSYETTILSVLPDIHEYNNMKLQEIAGLSLDYITINNYLLHLKSGVIYPLNSGSVQVYALVVKTDSNGDYKYITADSNKKLLYKDGDKYYCYGEENQLEEYTGDKMYDFEYISQGVNVTISEYLKITGVDIFKSVEDATAGAGEGGEGEQEPVNNSLIKAGKVSMVIGTSDYASAVIVFAFNIESEFKKAFNANEITCEADAAVITIQKISDGYYFSIVSVDVGSTALIVYYKDEAIFSVTVEVLRNAVTEITLTPNCSNMKVGLSGSSYAWYCLDSDNEVMEGESYKLQMEFAPLIVDNISVYLNVYSDANCTIPADNVLKIEKNQDNGAGSAYIYSIDNDGNLDITITPLTINKTVYLQAVSATDSTVKSNVVVLNIQEFNFQSITYYYEDADTGTYRVISGTETDISSFSNGTSSQYSIIAVYDNVQGQAIYSNQENSIINFRLATESLGYKDNCTIINGRIIKMDNILEKTTIELEVYTDFGYIFPEHYKLTVLPSIFVTGDNSTDSNRLEKMAGESINIFNESNEINTSMLVVKDLKNDNFFKKSDVLIISSQYITFNESTKIITISDGITAVTPCDIFISLQGGYQVVLYVLIQPTKTFELSLPSKYVDITDGTDYVNIFQNSKMDLSELVTLVTYDGQPISDPITYTFRILETDNGLISVSGNYLVVGNISGTKLLTVEVTAEVADSATYTTYLYFKAVSQPVIDIRLGYEGSYEQIISNDTVQTFTPTIQITDMAGNPKDSTVKYTIASFTTVPESDASEFTKTSEVLTHTITGVKVVEISGDSIYIRKCQKNAIVTLDCEFTIDDRIYNITYVIKIV